ncbi:hypothetical protein NDA07_14130 [Microcoleus vaginatus DQ-U2]|uniref:hypothetical protein n=1 Tax=Microcoleus vaginatus TaxID=119532 RepID=UPI0016885A71|nr:hypothetical protein [Microcoleus sp. FACHB-DQ6]
MNNPSSDQELVNFLKQHRPSLPESAPDLELKILAAIESNQASLVNETHREKTRVTTSPKSNDRLKISSVSKWAVSSAIAAGLLVFWSGYRQFETAQLPDEETAKLEAFLVTNWEGVLHDSPQENMTDRSQTDWLTFSQSADSEPPTNN